MVVVVVVVAVEYDAETSLGLFKYGRDRVAGHRRPRGRATAAVRITVVRRVMVAVGLVERQPTSCMVVLLRRQRVMVMKIVVLLQVLVVVVVVVLLVMGLQRISVRAYATAAHGHRRAAVIVERTAALVLLIVLIVHRAYAHATDPDAVHRVQFVRVRGAPALRHRHALLVTEQLPFQTVVLRLQGRDFAPVCHKRNKLLFKVTRVCV